MRGIRKAVVLSFVLTVLAGCAGSPRYPESHISVVPSSPPPAIDGLRAAFVALATTPYRYTAELEGRGAAVRGTFDAVRNTFDVQVYAGQMVGVDNIEIGTDFYLKDTVSDRPAAKWPKNKWMHIDGKRAVKYAPLDGGYTGTAGYSAYAAAFVTANRKADKAYEGVLDLTKIRLSRDLLARFPHGGTDVSYEATVDDKGIAKTLTFATYQDAKAAPTTQTVTIADAGAPVTIAPPPAKDTIEAPDAVYKAYGG